MTSSPHDPADCELAVCDRCDSYGDGYSAGKDAAYFAISTWELGAHASDCGCRPCETIRQVVRKVRQVSRSCCPTGTSRTALALAARHPAGAGATPLTETDWAALLEPVVRGAAPAPCGLAALMRIRTSVSFRTELILSPLPYSPSLRRHGVRPWCQLWSYPISQYRREGGRSRTRAAGRGVESGRSSPHPSDLD